jgi:hypothetical protein
MSRYWFLLVRPRFETACVWVDGDDFEDARRPLDAEVLDDGVPWALQPFDQVGYAPFGVMALKEEELVSDGESLHVAEKTWTALGHTAHRFLTLVAETDTGTAYVPGQPWFRVLTPDELCDIVSLGWGAVR